MTLDCGVSGSLPIIPYPPVREGGQVHGLILHRMHEFVDQYRQQVDPALSRGSCRSAKCQSGQAGNIEAAVVIDGNRYRAGRL